MVPPVAAGMGVVYAVLRLAPWSPAPVGVGLDESWRWIVTDAWRRGLISGTEIVFTVGPFGFLTTETFHPATYPPMLGIQAALIVLLVLAFRAVLVRRASGGWTSVLVLPVVAECIGLWELGQTLYFHLGLALVALHWSRDAPRGDTAADGVGRSARGERVLLHLLAAGMALAALVKFSYGAFGAVALGAVVLDEIGRRRRWPWLLLTYVATWLALWLLAGQPLPAIGRYFINSADIAAGFNAAMALDGPRREVVAYLAAAGLLVVLWALEREPRDGRRGWLPVATLAVLLFLVFKVCFVRHDAHALTAAPLLLPWCIVGLAASTGRGGTRAARIAASCAVVAALVYAGLVVPQYRGSGLQALMLRHLAAWPARLASAADALRGADALRERHRAAVERIRREIPLPPLRGGVDLYPSFQGLLLAQGLAYRPRPVIQSYSAYTPHLARINARHLASEAAPDEILFLVQPIDGRFPSLDDGPSWPSLMTRYDLVGRVGEFARMARSSRPRQERLRRLGRWTVRVGERFVLPPGTRRKMVWATLDLLPSAWGRLRSIAYKTPAVELAVGLRDGRRERYRLIPGIARAGFLLSPRIADTADWVRLVSPAGRPQLEGVEITNLAVVGRHGAGLGGAFRAEVRVELWELDTGAGRGASRSGDLRITVPSHRGARWRGLSGVSNGREVPPRARGSR